ncbi:hypothetical protein [Terricaulis silvestris]|uniref:Cbb3-type cytochrome oxidase, subunit 1 n=1 Tax=Terricaulis silvestris TaxID=2686094 RepID=A0A6I6MKL6_9CAUL|nr:hypothetical protein [Terricaulis silvestris]QGZ95885.1 hypothetical protein DSM104635_02740 [Terricaulis silvestris]
MRYDLIFITTALLCLLVGETLGIHMGISQDFTLVPAHVHLNLLGWVTLAAFGLMHRAYPALGASRMALVQCVLAIIANIAMPAGLALMLLSANHDPTLVKYASLAVILATVLFIIMFVRKVALAKAA